MNTPKDLKYTKDHEWLRDEGEHAVIGITAHAQEALGDVAVIDVRAAKGLDQGLVRLLRQVEARAPGRA